MKDLFILYCGTVVFGTFVPAFLFFYCFSNITRIFKYLIKTSLYNLQ